MGLRLVLGRAGSGKSRLFTEEISRMMEQRSDASLFLVVPEQFSLQAERSLASASKNGGIMGTEVLSFRRMAYRVFGDTGCAAHPPLNSACRYVLLWRIMRKLSGKLEIFGAAASRKGFISTLANTISEFKRYDAGPAAVAAIASRLPAGGLLKAKLDDLAAIYGAFEEDIAGRFSDPDDHLAGLAGKIRRHAPFDGAHIWIDGFSGFTPQEYNVIGELMKAAARVSVSLCADCMPPLGGIRGGDISGKDVNDGSGKYDIGKDETGVFEPCLKTAYKLIRLAGACGAYVEKSVLLDPQPPFRYSGKPALAHLEKHAFSYPIVPYGAETGDICLFTAVNAYSEVEETARDILRLCRDEGFKYKDIAVVSGNLDEYERLVRVVFREYGIPCFIDRKRDVKGHPLTVTLLSALAIGTNGWAYDDVFSYLKSGFANIGRDDTDRLENLALSRGLRGAAWTDDARWAFMLERTPERMPEKRMDAARKAFVRPLEKLFEDIARGRTVRAACTALFDFMCAVGIPDRLKLEIGEFGKAGEPDMALEYRQVWDILMEALDGMVSAAGDDAASMEDFAEMLDISLDGYSIGLIPPAQDQVQVGSMERSKSHDITALYIIGANDGVFPAAVFDEGILSDRDREQIGVHGMELAPDTRQKLYEERFTAYSALATPSGYLRLSFPLADFEGRAMRPSMFISELKKLFPHMKEYSNIAGVSGDAAALDLIAAAGPTFNELVLTLGKARGNGNAGLGSVWTDVRRWYMREKSWRERCRGIMSWMAGGCAAPPLGRETALSLYGKPVYTSISRMECYSACPFSFFIRYGLRASERKLFGLDAPDIGTLMHSVLEIFSRKLEAEEESLDGIGMEYCRTAASSIVDDIISSMPGSVFDSSGKYRYMTSRLKRIAARSAWTMLRHLKSGDFKPLDYEAGFGDGGRYPPVEVRLESGESMYLTGRIDRIDVFETEEGAYLRIVDYKSGRKSFRLSDVYYGLDLQLPAYLDALWESKAAGSTGTTGTTGTIGTTGTAGTFGTAGTAGTTSAAGTGALALPAGILYFKVDEPMVKALPDIPDDRLEDEIAKQLRMEGLLLADIKLIRSMDRDISGSSRIIPASVKKDETLGRSSAATMEQFGYLRKHVRGLLSDMGTRMSGGDVSISPYKMRKETPCSYCSYLPVCQFDRSSGGSYRILGDIGDDEVWEKLKND